jgi:SAM-dependent methyltransferase
MTATATPVTALVKLDLGCGPNPKEGFTGVDRIDFGKNIVADLTKPWPWADSSVDEVNCSHNLEHYDAIERCHFWNELHRVLKPGAKATIITPHWASNRAYGDPTHKWPPVSEMAFFYLSKKWRDANAPHCNDLLKCDLEASWGYSINPGLAGRNQEFVNEALSWKKEAAQDIIATVTKVKV